MRLHRGTNGTRLATGTLGTVAIWPAFGRYIRRMADLVGPWWRVVVRAKLCGGWGQDGIVARCQKPAASRPAAPQCHGLQRSGVTGLGVWIAGRGCLR
jgi:hypothetical protein